MITIITTTTVVTVINAANTMTPPTAALTAMIIVVELDEVDVVDVGVTVVEFDVEFVVFLEVLPDELELLLLLGVGIAYVGLKAIHALAKS